MTRSVSRHEGTTLVLDWPSAMQHLALKVTYKVVSSSLAPVKGPSALLVVGPKARQGRRLPLQARLPFARNLISSTSSSHQS